MQRPGGTGFMIPRRPCSPLARNDGTTRRPEPPALYPMRPAVTNLHGGCHARRLALTSGRLGLIMVRAGVPSVVSEGVWRRVDRCAS